jgi:hypothetical protein
MDKAFSVKDPDWKTSPFTGMTKRHYVDCAKYMLERAFIHVKSIDDPLSFPTVPGKTYPQPGAPDWRWRSAEWEALERTFTLAGPLIHLDPDTRVRGIRLLDYYRLHVERALTPGNPESLPQPEDLPDATYQFTCEFGGLFKTLLLMPDALWTHFTKEQQDRMAVTISKWGHHRTTQNNWRIFNIVTLSFLKLQGYPIDDEALKAHLLWVASYHSGNGWYLEQTYNYYTISLFIVYMTIWNRAFGDRHYPMISDAIERSARELMKTYPFFFGRDGFVNMWARSICYRTWISGGFPVSFMMKGKSPLDPGWARRLCSGSLLQFVTREDFFENDIPALGFYGHREFAVQNYSCPGSPFIMFLPFICLALPDDSPFWTARENEGMWPGLKRRSRMTVLENPGIVLVNHGTTGTSEIIPGKVYYQDPNYSKLSYNTHFPWEDHDPEGGTAMEYAFHSLDPRDQRGDDVNFYLTGHALKNDADHSAVFSTSEAMLYNGVRKGVIYRQAIMRRPPNNGVGYIIDLAEVPIPGGVLRVDRSRLAFEHELTLGHYGLPRLGGRDPELRVSEREGARRITASIEGRSLALIAYRGWDEVASKSHEGRNAETEGSTVIYAKRRRLQKNPPMELMIAVFLHRTDGAEWTEEELSPVESIEIMDITPSRSALGARIHMRGGPSYIIDFKDIDGYRSC